MNRPNASGYALVAVLAIVTVILVSSMSQVGEFFGKNRMLASKEGKQNRLEFIDSLEEILMDNATLTVGQISNATLACNAVATNFSARWPRNFRNMTWQLWPGTGATANDPKRTDAINRCQTRQRLAPTDNYAGLNTIYFCLQLATTGASEKIPNVLFSGPVFVEAAITLKNMMSSTFFNCSNFTTIPVAERGATLTYTLYWTNQITGKEVHFSETQTRNFLTN